MNSKKQSAFALIGAGVVVGAVAMAGVLRSGSVTPAVAGSEHKARPIAGITSENMAALRNLDSSFASLAEYVEPAVVHIRSESKRETDMFGRRMGLVGGEGSGVIFRPDGYIITNDHVVGGFEKVTVVLNDGREFPGKVIRATDQDIAVVKIDATGLPSLPFADSGSVKPGQFAMAIGSPFGLENTVTVGHISALGRQTQVGDSRLGQARNYTDLIQTDAAINQGNSGGPLVNIDGEVVGINTAIYSTTGGGMGIGFAIPSNQARMLAETLIEKGKVVRGYMGVAPDTVKEFQKKELGIEGGARVMEVPSNGPAAAAGMKEGDIITRINDLPIRNQQDVRSAMLRFSPGSTVTVEALRDKTKKTFSVKLVEPPKENTSLRRAEPEGNGLVVPDMPGMDGFKFQMPDSGKSDVPPVREGKAKLGVSVEDVSANLRKQFTIPSEQKGAVVTLVEPGSVAERLGMKQGDVITRIGDKTVTSAADLVDAVKGFKWGDSTNIGFVRFAENSRMEQSLPLRFR